MDRENRVFGNNMRFYSHQNGRQLNWLAEERNWNVLSMRFRK